MVIRHFNKKLLAKNIVTRPMKYVGMEYLSYRKSTTIDGFEQEIYIHLSTLDIIGRY